MSFSVEDLLACTLALIVMATAGPARAADDPGSTPSAEEVAAMLANPNATLGFLAFNIDYVQYAGEAPGADRQSAPRLAFQPSVPYPLNESTNFFLRPLIPVFLDQPVPAVGDAGSLEFDGSGLQLGDISFDAAIGKTFDSRMVLFAGAIGTLPTATDDRVGLNQYLLGPEFFIGRGAKWGFVGVLLTHQWDIAGEDAYSTSISGGQYFYTINLENAWQIQAQPTFAYNHEAQSGNQWTLPLGVGASKTVVLGKTPWKFNLQYWYYLESPEIFGPKHQVRFQITPVIPLPW